MNQEGDSSLNQRHLEKLNLKAKEMGYSNLTFFFDDLDVLLRPAKLLKQKDIKYFELENLISSLNSKKINLEMAPQMINMASNYQVSNEKLEKENTELKQLNISLKSKHEIVETQIKEYQRQLQDLSVSAQSDARFRDENIKLTEENKYLKITNESLSEDLKKTKDKLESKATEANNLEIENSQLETRVKDLQKDIQESEKKIEELKQRGESSDETLKRITKLIEELDELYGTINDPFKREFLAFFGIELAEIVDNKHISKQKILNQIAIHAMEIEKTFEPKNVAMRQQQITPMSTSTAMSTASKSITNGLEKPDAHDGKFETKDRVPEPVIRKPTTVESIPVEEKSIEEDTGDQYVKPSEFLKRKTAEATEDKTSSTTSSSEEDIPQPKTATYIKKPKTKQTAPVDRTPSADLIKVFDVFIKYIEAINDTNSFNDLCDKIIEQLYEHVGSPGMTHVYKIKSGGVKRKQMLIDLIKQWKVTLPEM